LAFTKFTAAEDYKVASPKEVEEIEGQLKLFKVKSVNDLPTESKQHIARTLDTE
jgi:hypothetical protein